MTYSIKEMFYTLQGEGAQTGRASVFLRFAGCNLWSGLEIDRTEAVCKFCDTDFVGTDGTGGGKFKTPEALAEAVDAQWPKGGQGKKYVVCTGGEPLLQLDVPLIVALKAQGFEVAIETNGTKRVPEGVDWVCVSPKGTSHIIVTQGNELKLVYPQADCLPEQFEEMSFDHFFLQPMDSSEKPNTVQKVISYCLAHPKWRMSLQTHKIVGIA
jgi:7-carboxy-7-deazaguanine synthase (Cx14CxxC type)